MRITPNHIAIGRIFEQNFLFEVPKYQRYFAWDEEQVTDFIKDIDNILLNNSPENPLEHFFGGIVCASKVVEGSTRQQKELIDGQQRITTTILLIVNMIRAYTELKGNSKATADDISILEKRIEGLKRTYLFYDDEINRKPQTVQKLVLSLADKSFFECIMNGCACDPTRDSHRRIKRADNLLGRYVVQKLDKCSDLSEKIDLLLQIEQILKSNCTVIFMDCDTRTSAYKLFQVLNDRGAGLTEGDLLKSKTLEALEAYPQEQEQAQTWWDEILENEPSKVEGFLRTYYASVCGGRAGRASLYDNFLEAFFPDLFKGEVPRTQEAASQLSQCIRNLLLEARNYHKIINGQWPFDEAQPVTEWDRNRLKVLVKFLSYDITLPLLLAATKLGHKKFSVLVHCLEKFMFRYKTICGNSHQPLSDLFCTEAKKIRTNSSTYSFASLFAELRGLLDEKAGDEIFKVQLKNLQYTTRGGNKSLRYFFSTLCDYYRWHEDGENGKPKASKENIINYDNVTIEHIDAQNPDTERVISESEEHKFFNLTILSGPDNGERVKNKSFIAKKPVYQSSSYRINQRLNTYAIWSLENANDWQSFVVDLACKIFVI